MSCLFCGGTLGEISTTKFLNLVTKTCVGTQAPDFSPFVSILAATFALSKDLGCSPPAPPPSRSQRPSSGPRLPLVLCLMPECWLQGPPIFAGSRVPQSLLVPGSSNLCWIQGPPHLCWLQSPPIFAGSRVPQFFLAPGSPNLCWLQGPPHLC